MISCWVDERHLGRRILNDVLTAERRQLLSAVRTYDRGDAHQPSKDLIRGLVARFFVSDVCIVACIRPTRKAVLQNPLI